jgi:hypothetical protein
LRAELENFDIFEHVAAEKITPKFLKLAQSSQPKVELDIIKNDNGLPFASDNERHSYITDYYSDIYRLVPDEVIAPEGCVREFLGPEIVNRPEVSSKKVPVFLKNKCEQMLTINELDEAVKTMKNALAGGAGWVKC